MIYISTDYVFSGRPGEAPYEADATPAPTNLYGQTKLDGERAVLGEFGDDSGRGVVLRVPILYGSAERGDESAVNVLMEGVRRAQGGGEVVKMDHWALRYPTNTEDVGRVCHGEFVIVWIYEVESCWLMMSRCGCSLPGGAWDGEGAGASTCAAVLERGQVHKV